MEIGTLGNKDKAVVLMGGGGDIGGESLPSLAGLLDILGRGGDCSELSTLIALEVVGVGAAVDGAGDGAGRKGKRIAQPGAQVRIGRKAGGNADRASENQNGLLQR